MTSQNGEQPTSTSSGNKRRWRLRGPIARMYEDRDRELVKIIADMEETLRRLNAHE
jgi:hypothetical protein